MTTIITTTTNDLKLDDNSLTTVKQPAKQPAPQIPTDGTGVLSLDPWLEPFQDYLRERFSKAQNWIKKLEETEGGLDKFSKVRHAIPSALGLTDPVSRVMRSLESPWIRTATSPTASGRRMPSMPTSLENSVSTLSSQRIIPTDPVDNWDRLSHSMTKNPYGVWEITLPAVNGKTAIEHGSKVKVGSPRTALGMADAKTAVYIDHHGDAAVRAH